MTFIRKLKYKFLKNVIIFYFITVNRKLILLHINFRLNKSTLNILYSNYKTNNFTIDLDSFSEKKLSIIANLQIKKHKTFSKQ